MALTPIPPGLAHLAKVMPDFVRRNILLPNCTPELPVFGMFASEGQFIDTPPATTPRWTTDSPPPIPPPTPVNAIYGTLMSVAQSGAVNLVGTVFLGPTTQMVTGVSAGAVAFKLPYAITLIGISVTMAAALAAAHTINFRYNIAGVDSGVIVASLSTGAVDGFATGSIAVPAGNAIAIKAVQSGGGGDQIQSLTVIYQ